MTLVHHLLEESATRFGTREALTGDGRRITYAELDREAECVASALVTAGVERGDRVVVFMDNSVETVASIFGALKAGCCFQHRQPDDEAGQADADPGQLPPCCNRRR